MLLVVLSKFNERIGLRWW